MTDQQYWIDTYDEVGSAYEEAQTLDVLRKETIDRAIADIEQGRVSRPELDVADWCRTQFDAHVEPERNRRANTLNRDLDYLLDGFEEDGTYVDPLLSQVHRLGDGTDKVLRLWRAEDWHEWAYRRLQAAAKVSAAARESDEKAERMIGRLRDRGVRFTGDLYH